MAGISNEITKKIREDWGTIPTFAKKNNLCQYTVRQVLYGTKTSKKVLEALKKYKYIKSADDIKRKVA